MMLTAVPDLESVVYAKEDLPAPKCGFDLLFIEHGREVRGKPFELDFARYRQIWKENRLVWIVASSVVTGAPIGYACAFWYRDLHFDERVAVDDLWFVRKGFRGKGIGKTLKVMCHCELTSHGVVRVYDTIRGAYNHPTLMQDLGFEKWGHRWQKML